MRVQKEVLMARKTGARNLTYGQFVAWRNRIKFNNKRLMLKEKKKFQRRRQRLEEKAGQC